MNIKPNKMKLIRNCAVATLGLMALTSCDAMKDDLDPCPYTDDTVISFYYKYNMSNVDLFSSNVHCIDLYIFDQKTHQFVTYYQETNPAVVQSGHFYVTLPLEKGDYTAVVYGGAACGDSSFDKGFTVNDNLKYEDLSLSLNSDFYFDDSDATGDVFGYLTDRSNLKLHPLFYGRLDFTVKETRPTRGANDYQVPMMRNTNTLTLTVKNKNGESLNIEDYHFMLKDVNNDFDHTNYVSDNGEIMYRPYEKENNPDGTAYVSFAVSRLTTYNDPVLIISDAQNNQVSLKVLNEILSLLSELDLDFELSGDQEYLDREHHFELEVGLGEENGVLQADIKVKPWDVRNDDIDAF